MELKEIFQKLIKIAYYAVIFTILIPICAIFLTEVYNNFMISSISFTLDTLFLDWNTTFSGVTICEIYNGEKNWDLNEEHFGTERDFRLDDFVGEITFYRGSCESCFNCGNMSCPTNFGELIETFRTPCENLLSDCIVNDESIECCEKFKPIQTEFGQCYSFNSIQAGDEPIEILYMNREVGPGKVKFSVHEDIQIHIHPSNDIPYLYSEGVIKETVLWGSRKEIILNVMEIFNDQSVYHTTPEFRNCRFVNELHPKENHLFKYYGYSTCVVECVVDLQMEMCGCNFFNPYLNESLCDIEGLKCLAKNVHYFVEKRPDCDCMLSCEEPEYNIVYTSPEQSNEEGQSSTVIISMIDLPTQRYIRNVVKTDLDLFISIGGIAGLFFGVSFISIIEMIYNIFIHIKKLKIRRKINSELN